MTEYVSNFKQKAGIFNEYFANQCTINDNGSVLSGFSPHTDTSLSHIYATYENIVKIINDFYSKKAHGCDGIAVSMLELCATGVAHPLRITTCVFLDSWKYASVQPIHKKKTISLLPICGKILEKIVLDKLYAFFNKNNLFSSNQSGFETEYSTIYQLLTITTSTIYENFEYNEPRGIFLDISEAFDKVWHDGVIFLDISEAFDKVWHDGVIFLDISEAFDKVWHGGVVFLDISEAFDKVWHDGVIFLDISEAH